MIGKTVFLLFFGVVFFSGCAENKIIALPASLDVNDLKDVSDYNNIKNNDLLLWNSSLAKWENRDQNVLSDVNNADFLDGIDSTGFIRTDGTSTTTASVPFAEGLTSGGFSYTKDGNLTFFNAGCGGSSASPSRAIQCIITSSTIERVINMELQYTGAANILTAIVFDAIWNGTTTSALNLVSRFRAILLKPVNATSNNIAGIRGIGRTEFSDWNSGQSALVMGVQGQVESMPPLNVSSGTLRMASVMGDSCPNNTTNIPTNTTTIGNFLCWAGLFQDDVQITSNKKLILEGTTTSKGDVSIDYNSNALSEKMRFFINSTTTPTFELSNNQANTPRLQVDLNANIDQNLNVNGNYFFKKTKGLTQTLYVADSALGVCFIDVNGGIITASNCT